jgi:hypothetical protein
MSRNHNVTERRGQNQYCSLDVADTGLRTTMESGHARLKNLVGRAAIGAGLCWHGDKAPSSFGLEVRRERNPADMFRQMAGDAPELG